MEPHSARTKLACEIARLNPQRLNEAIHAGFLPCAPGTTAGSARIFSIDDIVVLCVYAMLLEEKMSAERAGHIACEIKLKMGETTDGFVTYTRSPNGSRNSTSNLLGADKTIAPASHIPLRISFDVAGLRRTVISDLNYDAGIRGDD